MSVEHIQTPSLTPEFAIKTSMAATRLRVEPDEAYVSVFVGEESLPWIVDLRNGAVLSRSETAPDEPCYLSRRAEAILAPDRKTLYRSRRREIELVDVQTGQVRATTIPLGAPILGMEASPDGRWLVAWDIRSPGIEVFRSDGTHHVTLGAIQPHREVLPVPLPPHTALIQSALEGCRMARSAISYMWWQLIDEQLELAIQGTWQKKRRPSTSVKWGIEKWAREGMVNQIAALDKAASTLLKLIASVPERERTVAGSFLAEELVYVGLEALPETPFTEVQVAFARFRGNSLVTNAGTWDLETGKLLRSSPRVLASSVLCADSTSVLVSDLTQKVTKVGTGHLLSSKGSVHPSLLDLESGVAIHVPFVHDVGPSVHGVVHYGYRLSKGYVLQASSDGLRRLTAGGNPPSGGAWQDVALPLTTHRCVTPIEGGERVVSLDPAGTVCVWQTAAIAQKPGPGIVAIALQGQRVASLLTDADGWVCRSAFLEIRSSATLALIARHEVPQAMLKYLLRGSYEGSLFWSGDDLHLVGIFQTTVSFMIHLSRGVLTSTILPEGERLATAVVPSDAPERPVFIERQKPVLDRLERLNLGDGARRNISAGLSNLPQEERMESWHRRLYREEADGTMTMLGAHGMWRWNVASGAPLESVLFEKKAAAPALLSTRRAIAVESDYAQVWEFGEGAVAKVNYPWDFGELRHGPALQLSGGLVALAGLGSVLLWRLETGETHVLLERPWLNPTWMGEFAGGLLAIHHAGEVLPGTSRHGFIELWDPDSQRLLERWAVPGAPIIDRCGDMIAVASRGQDITVMRIPGRARP